MVVGRVEIYGSETLMPLYRRCGISVWHRYGLRWARQNPVSLSRPGAQTSAAPKPPSAA